MRGTGLARVHLRQGLWNVSQPQHALRGNNIPSVSKEENIMTPSVEEQNKAIVRDGWGFRQCRWR